MNERKTFQIAFSQRFTLFFHIPKNPLFKPVMDELLVHLCPLKCPFIETDTIRAN
jgi:hypothetical protein